MKTSTKLGLIVPVAKEPPPAAAVAPMAETPAITSAAPAIPAAIYDIAGTLNVFPLLTAEVMQAISCPPSVAFNSKMASAAMSGTWKAIAGIREAYCAGIAWTP